MNTVYTNPPTTQSSALDDAKEYLKIVKGETVDSLWGSAEVTANVTTAFALVSIAETLAALLPATQEIAGALAGAYSPDAGALAVVDANAAVERVEPYPNDEIGKGATSAQITTDELRDLRRRFNALRLNVKHFVNHSSAEIDTSALEDALREAIQP